jgi:glucuronate isomerase
MSSPTWFIPEDRFFDPDPTQRRFAQELYSTVKDLPIVSPHGHVDPKLFTGEGSGFGTPADLLIIPDHYVFRMLYSQGVSLDSMGIPRQDGKIVESDHRKIWQFFADHFYLFRGTPTGIWLTYELDKIFGIRQKLTSQSAQSIYDELEARMKLPEYQPRQLFESMNIEVLCTTDLATDTLDTHKMIKESGWKGNIRPTFRPDAVVNIDTENWIGNIQLLEKVSGISIGNYRSFITALESRRVFFKSMGAVATDHAVLTPFSVELSEKEANDIFQRALKGAASAEDSMKFSAHMLIELARMSVEDGLVMQIHPGSFRNHNERVFNTFGRDKGADIPISTEYTRNLLPLLNKYGNDPRLTIILFTLDETNYSRELAPLAGHYPCLKLGAPWWFHDSLNGMQRYFDQVMETAGIYNTVGFTDDTRAFPSIPARHDVWRRASCNWVAGLFARGMVDMDDAREIVIDLAYRLSKQAYRLM